MRFPSPIYVSSCYSYICVLMQEIEKIRKEKEEAEARAVEQRQRLLALEEERLLREEAARKVEEQLKLMSDQVSVKDEALVELGEEIERLRMEQDAKSGRDKEVYMYMFWRSIYVYT